MTPWKISMSWRYMLPVALLGSTGLLLSPLIGVLLVGLGLFHVEPRGNLWEKLSRRYRERNEQNRRGGAYCRAPSVFSFCFLQRYTTSSLVTAFLKNLRDILLAAVV